MNIDSFLVGFLAQANAVEREPGIIIIVNSRWRKLNGRCIIVAEVQHKRLDGTTYGRAEDEALSQFEVGAEGSDFKVRVRRIVELVVSAEVELVAGLSVEVDGFERAVEPDGAIPTPVSALFGIRVLYLDRIEDGILDDAAGWAFGRAPADEVGAAFPNLVGFLEVHSQRAGRFVEARAGIFSEIELHYCGAFERRTRKVCQAEGQADGVPVAVLV